MKDFKPIYVLSFYLITLVTFVFGGSIQFLFGVSNTILTFFLTGSLFAVYILYALLKNRLATGNIMYFSLFYIIVVLFTALIRQNHIILTLTYLIFPLLPLGVYLFSFINYKEGYLSFEKVFRLFYYIALIQLPIMLVQKNFFSFLIKFNNSGQTIEWFDFMFGSFFIKSDHSLGVFLLLIIALILFKRNSLKSIIKFHKLAILYLGITLFLTESNISKLLFVILISTFFIIPIYKKYSGSLKFKISVLLLAGAILITGYNLREEQFIQDKLGGKLEKQFSIDNARKFYELGTAKRFQIILVAATQLKTKWIGDGPYSYFDIRTGKFKQTRHFTQLIWTYYDLGLLGLLIVLGYIISMLRYLDIEKGIPFMFALGIFLVYSLYTTILSDIAIMFGIMSIFNRKNMDLQ